MGATVDSGVAAVVEKLKSLKAAKLRVECLDGEVRRVKVSTSRKRWAQLRTMLEALEWVTVEAQNARGETLHVFDSGIRPDDEDEPESMDARVVELARRMLDLTLTAQDKALARQTEHVKELLDSAVKLNRVMADRLIAVERMYEAKLKTIDSMWDGDDSEPPLLSAKLIEAMAPLVAQKLMPVKGEDAG